MQDNGSGTNLFREFCPVCGAYICEYGVCILPFVVKFTFCKFPASHQPMYTASLEDVSATYLAPLLYLVQNSRPNCISIGTG